MKTATKRTRSARNSAKKTAQSLASAGKFMRQTFYYLKGEQLLKASNRLLCENH